MLLPPILVIEGPHCLLLSYQNSFPHTTPALILHQSWTQSSDGLVQAYLHDLGTTQQQTELN